MNSILHIQCIDKLTFKYINLNFLIYFLSLERKYAVSEHYLFITGLIAD